jgi:16S rRNA (cytidine1402-2'-O)-methyltransferase
VKENSRFFLVPTPIGNMEDITIRALRVLAEVDLILAEDTRVTVNLLRHHSIKNKLQSFHAFNEHKFISSVVEKLKKGSRIALVTDAGTPGISDPGYLAAKACIENSIPFECLPGATALVPALVLSGLPSDTFIFVGFLPVKKGRNKLLVSLAEETRTMIFYESPFKILKTLKDLSIIFGSQRKASVSRELTKLFEQTIRGSLDELVTHFEKTAPKGEMVIVVSGKDK